MKKMIKSLLVSGLVLASPLAGVVGGQEVNAQTIKETPVTLNVTDSQNLQFTGAEDTDTINFNIETSFTNWVTNKQTAVVNDGDFIISFKDERLYSDYKILTAKFTPDNNDTNGFKIVLDANGVTNANIPSENYESFKPSNVNTNIEINDSQPNRVFESAEGSDQGKGEWNLHFVAKELSIPKNAEIKTGAQNIGVINWYLSNTQ